MKLSKETMQVMKLYSSINSNLLILPGNKLTTMAASKDIMAECEVAETFDKTGGIFNLNELLGVMSLFHDPEVVMDDKWMTISEGRNKIKYVYADASLLTVPKKSITMPAAEIKFALPAEVLTKIQKASNALSVGDLMFKGNGKNIIATVLDAKNPTSNNFEIDLESETTEKFEVYFKIEKLKLYPVDYTVEISSKKISKFSAVAPKITVFVAVEPNSVF